MQYFEINHNILHKKPKKIITRKAVRAITFVNSKILLVRSNKVGDYKFPGGGIEKNETSEQALKREVIEETGYTVKSIGELVINVNENSNDKYLKNTIFNMSSDYYLCEVYNTKGNQNLDQYELDLGFEPIWINLNQAIDENKKLLTGHKHSSWINREIKVMEAIKNLIKLC